MRYDDIEQPTKDTLVDLVLAHAGTPRRELFEYPHRDDDSRDMIRKADNTVRRIVEALP